MVLILYIGICGLLNLFERVFRQCYTFTNLFVICCSIITKKCESISSNRIRYPTGFINHLIGGAKEYRTTLIILFAGAMGESTLLEKFFLDFMHVFGKFDKIVSHLRRRSLDPCCILISFKHNFNE